MKAVHIVLVIAASFAMAFASENFMPRVGEEIAKKETAYERVMRTGTLRCGYFISPVFIDRDPNTGALSGVFYDLAEEIGKQLSLKVVWAEEVSSLSPFEGLKVGRFDLMCAPFAPTAPRARAAEFTVPTAYRPYFAYARVDDTRFDNDYGKINNPSVKVSFVEGEYTQVFKEQEFPKATSVSLPAFTDYTQNEMQVATRKADLAFAEPLVSERYIKSNPGKIRRVAGPPLRMIPAPLSVGIGEEKLKSLLNTTLEVLQGTGFIKKAYARHAASGDMFYFPAQPWQVASERP